LPLSPPPVARGSARGVLALREPTGEDAVVELLQSFLEGWQHESLDALMALVAPVARPLQAAGPGPPAPARPRGPRRRLASAPWRARLRAARGGRSRGPSAGQTRGRARAGAAGAGGAP